MTDLKPCPFCGDGPTPEVRTLIYAARVVMHDLQHGNGLEGLYKNRDRLEVALSAFEGDA